MALVMLPLHINRVRRKKREKKKKEKNSIYPIARQSDLSTLRLALEAALGLGELRAHAPELRRGGVPLLPGRGAAARVRPYGTALLTSPRLGDSGQVRAARRHHTWDGGAGRALRGLARAASAREAVASGLDAVA